MAGIFVLLSFREDQEGKFLFQGEVSPLTKVIS